MKRQIKKVAAVLLAVAMTLGVTACGGGGSKAPANAGDRTVIYYAASYVTAQVREAYLELVKTYNEGQGVEDGVYVQMTENSGAIAGLDSALRSNYMYDVLQLQDDEYKALAIQGGYFKALDEFMTDDAKAAMNWDDIPDSLVNRFRMNQTADDKNIYQAGAGAELLALPVGNNPQVLFYNKAILEAARLDGGSFFQIFFQVMFPLAKPAFISQFIFGFVGGYNSYLGPQLYLQNQPKFVTLQLYLSQIRSLFPNAGSENIYSAAAILGMLPLIVIYCFMQKYFIEGITVGSVKE